MLGLRPRLVLRCCVWMNSRIRVSKQGVTNAIGPRYNDNRLSITLSWLFQPQQKLYWWRCLYQRELVHTVLCADPSRDHSLPMSESVHLICWIINERAGPNHDWYSTMDQFLSFLFMAVPLFSDFSNQVGDTWSSFVKWREYSIKPTANKKQLWKYLPCI